jgi:hypothetical protein
MVLSQEEATDAAEPVEIEEVEAEDTGAAEAAAKAAAEALLAAEQAAAAAAAAQKVRCPLITCQSVHFRHSVVETI